MIINPNRKDLIGKKVLLNHTDIKGNKYRKEMKKAVLENRGRFVTYYYKMPSGGVGKKITYIEYYKPLNILIASGVYIKYFDNNLKKEHLKEIKKSFIITIILIVVFYIFIIFVIIKYIKHLLNELEEYNKTFEKIIKLFKNLLKIENIFSSTYLIEEVNKLITTTLTLASPLDKSAILPTCIKITDDIYFYNPKKLNEKDEKVINLITEYLKNRIEIDKKMLNLEKTIQEEVEKNRVKDIQIMKQSRLAIMGQLLSMIAHQWRQPLTAIANYANDLLLNAMLDNLDNKKVEENANKIISLTQNLSQTINDFREFYKENKLKTKTNFNEIFILSILSSLLLDPATINRTQK